MYLVSQLLVENLRLLGEEFETVLTDKFFAPFGSNGFKRLADSWRTKVSKIALDGFQPRVVE